MLEKFIDMQCESFGLDRDKIYQNERIESLGNQSSKLAEKIKKLDETLGDEMDVLIGNMVAAYGDVYFQEGFKEGLILAQEIHQLLLKK